MRRREFGMTLASALLCAPRLACAGSRPPHVIVLWFGTAGNSGETIKGFQAGLRDFGYEEGRNVRSITITGTMMRPGSPSFRRPLSPRGRI
jgi:hypothetical protein